MRIGIVAKLKQGDILEALEKRRWNQTQGAEFLGVSPTTFGNLINMTDIPKTFSAHLTNKLVELTGKFPEDLFPEFIRSKDFLDRPKIATKIMEATPHLLSSIGAIPKMLPPPDESYQTEMTRETIQALLNTLPPENRDAIERHIMGEETLESIAQDIGITSKGVGARVNRGLRLLRDPARARKLRECL